MKKKFTVERPTPTTPIENRRRLIGPPLVNARNQLQNDHPPSFCTFFIYFLFFFFSYMDPSARKKKEEGWVSFSLSLRIALDT